MTVSQTETRYGPTSRDLIVSLVILVVILGGAVLYLVANPALKAAIRSATSEIILLTDTCFNHFGIFM